MNIYKRSYEKSIKEVKKDLLVLRFVSKTKTNLLRKYAEKIQGANKFIDAADLRPQLKLYLNHGFGRVTEIPSDSIYLKNQLKGLSEQDSLLNTAELNDFYLKQLCLRDREHREAIKRINDQKKKIQNRVNGLTGTMEKHRLNISTLPGLINSIIEEYMLQQDREESQENSINRGLAGLTSSRPGSQVKREGQVLITNAGQDDEMGREVFVRDFTTEVYGQLDFDQKKELILRLMSNKLLLFSFREFLLKRLEPTDLTGPDLITGPRGRSNKDRGRTEQSKTSRSDAEAHMSRSISNNKSQSANRTMLNLPKVGTAGNVSFSAGLSNIPKIRPGLNLTQENSLDLSKKYSHQRQRTEELSTPITMDVLGKRKILRYMVRKGIPGQEG